MCNKSECTASEQPCPTCVRLYGNRTNNGFDSNKPKPHKNADVLHAIAEGRAVQYRPNYNPPQWRDLDPDKDFSVIRSYEWRVKPVYPTLGEIAKKAWFDSVSRSSQGDVLWKIAGDAVAAAIKSGEFSES